MKVSGLPHCRVCDRLSRVRGLLFVFADHSTQMHENGDARKDATCSTFNAEALVDRVFWTLLFRPRSKHCTYDLAEGQTISNSKAQKHHVHILDTLHTELYTYILLQYAELLT